MIQTTNVDGHTYYIVDARTNTCYDRNINIIRLLVPIHTSN